MIQLLKKIVWGFFMLKPITNKAQSELVGLAMVVLLIVIGLLIAVSFSLRATNTDYAVEYQHQQLPVLLNDAILESHTNLDECHGEQIKKLLLKVAQKEAFECNNGKKLNTFLEKDIEKILNSTLDQWYITYKYTIYTGLDYSDKSKQLFYFTNSDDNCLNQNIETENFFFSMSNGDFLNMKLDICHE